MNDETLDSPSAIETFLAGTRNVKLSVPRKKRYAWMGRTLKRTRYCHLSKKEKSIIRTFMREVTGYSRAQLTRHIGAYCNTKWIGKKHVQRNSFPCKYTREDICLIAKTDEAHQTLSGATTKKLFERAYRIYEDKSYERLSTISVSHIYNLRKSTTYERQRYYFSKTQRSTVNIGERRKPVTNGQPGYIRIDTVHQGDEDKQKGVYHVNAVDEVTQFESICSVKKISERYLIPILEHILDTFPFNIKGFHSDNGSEYVNKYVAKLLNKLLIEFTKSRARHSNDNGLVESKNGSIVRKVLGHIHIPQKYAELINEFNKQYLVPYINFHRPCYFSEIKTDKKGKERKTYPYKLIMTPYEKMKSLPDAATYLKENVTFKELDKQAMSMTDLESATALLQARKKLFKKIFSDLK